MLVAPIKEKSFTHRAFNNILPCTQRDWHLFNTLLPFLSAILITLFIYSNINKQEQITGIKNNNEPANKTIS